MVKKLRPTTEFERALITLGLGVTSGTIGGISAMAARDSLIHYFSWGALLGETVRALLPHGPFLEVGCGSGYWAHELRLAGADVVATDLCDLDDHHYSGAVRKWVEHERLEATVAVCAYPNRTLLLVWPTYDDPWAAKALQAFERAGGQRLVYVGEGAGGCTADDAFHERLGSGWVEQQEVPHASWFGVHDRCTVYRRKP